MTYKEIKRDSQVNISEERNIRFERCTCFLEDENGYGCKATRTVAISLSTGDEEVTYELETGQELIGCDIISLPDENLKLSMTLPQLENGTLF